jgi:hypothetical protein
MQSHRVHVFAKSLDSTTSKQGARTIRKLGRHSKRLWFANIPTAVRISAQTNTSRSNDTFGLPTTLTIQLHTKGDLELPRAISRRANGLMLPSGAEALQARTKEFLPVLREASCNRNCPAGPGRCVFACLYGREVIDEPQPAASTGPAAAVPDDEAAETHRTVWVARILANQRRVLGLGRSTCTFLAAAHLAARFPFAQSGNSATD